jgi:hypothetical protein
MLSVAELKSEIKEAKSSELTQIITGEPRMLMDEAGDGSGITETITEIIESLNAKSDGQIDTICTYTETNGSNIIRPNHNPGGSPNCE